MAGYSKKSLVDKLGIKPGFKVYIVNPPKNYGDTLGTLPPDVAVLDAPDTGLNFIQFFTQERVELEAQFPALKKLLAADGMLWISWPKKASKIESDVNDGVVRAVGLRNGLVDVKVCAVDETWSGLKFVYRLEDRE